MMRSAETRMTGSRRPPGPRVSRASTVAVSGSRTPVEIRLCSCPTNATGWGGVMTVLAQPANNGSGGGFAATMEAVCSEKNRAHAAMSLRLSSQLCSYSMANKVGRMPARWTSRSTAARSPWPVPHQTSWPFGPASLRSLTCNDSSREPSMRMPSTGAIPERCQWPRSAHAPNLGPRPSRTRKISRGCQ